MANYKTHLTVIAEAAAEHPTTPAFQIPILDQVTGRVQTWQPISYQDFHADVEHFATYWNDILTRDGVQPRSVVGLWLGGITYLDVVHIYAVARAGYVPQLFSLRLPNPDIIYELLRKANAQALIFEPTYTPDLSNCHVPTHAAVDARHHDLSKSTVPPMTDLTKVKGTDTVVIFHTSGSTSGSPKLIPCSYLWLTTILAKAKLFSKTLRRDGPDVRNFIGSVCHIGQTFMLVGSLQNGACTVQPTTVDFSSEELLDMIVRCRLNRLTQFPAFLGIHMRNSRQNPKLLAQLHALDEIFYSGQAMPQEDEEWAYKNDMKLINVFANTECGIMLTSVRGGGRPGPSLRPIAGSRYGFFPVSGTNGQAQSAYHNLNGELVELVILSDSPDCPDPSLRAADGHYHTGDLFLEVEPGAYVSRGRNDDWIKSANCLRCDTKAIEDNVRATCEALISECIVVGNGRPSPVLFIESNPTRKMDDDKLKKEILRRTRHFHSRRYMHERITSAKMIVVVAAGTLPRTATKGNIRRRAVEDMFKSELDAVFSL
ncbi:acetyl-CoA synthetase-like protein [Rhodofomes roseus]|uniref:Acetyl-CoA synthetase-like protein n=1 Tax=Rhodofomes roseus TaxID=34475 RepID=A0ABQ8KEN0_9APHY|nr:acetyl-CoA synthetase-like protein [Rhodofomes roseus]KAH9836184.1 acetyl-CoA synthetase-like protein [Rhodofomes roseus]